MTPTTFTLHRTKETKNTYTFGASNGGMPVLYLHKSAVGDTPPDVIEVTVTPRA